MRLGCVNLVRCADARLWEVFVLDGGFDGALPKNRLVAAAGDFHDQRFGCAFRFKVVFNALAQFRCVHADDVVQAGVVIYRPPKDAGADFLFVDLVQAILEGTLADK